MDFDDVLRRGDPEHDGESEGEPGRYGSWTELVTELAGGDHERAERIFRWPLRVALRSYRRRVRELAMEDYRHRLLCWSVLAPHTAKGSRPKPPALPDILRGRPRHGGS